MSLTDRPTIELLMLIFAVVVGAAALLAGAGLFIVEVTHPEIDTSAAAAEVGQVFDVLIGLLIGYIAGRRPIDRPRRIGRSDTDE